MRSFVCLGKNSTRIVHHYLPDSLLWDGTETSPNTTVTIQVIGIVTQTVRHSLASNRNFVCLVCPFVLHSHVCCLLCFLNRSVYMLVVFIAFSLPSCMCPIITTMRQISVWSGSKFWARGEQQVTHLLCLFTYWFFYDFCVVLASLWYISCTHAERRQHARRQHAACT